MVRVAIALLLLLVPAAAQAEKRIALLIGNRGYQPVVGALKNPHNDIEVVSAALNAIGFKDRITHKDLRRSHVLGAVRQYAAQLAVAGPGAIGFLYYSGHGAAEHGTNVNYIIPVDAGDPNSTSFWDESVRLEEITRLILDRAPQAAHFVVFDACRNELKLPDKTATKGFVPVQTLRGMFVAFASEFGRTASDFGDKSGPYAAALASELVKPGLSHLDLFQNVKEAVARETGGRQSPWELNGLSQRVQLGPVAAPPPPPPQPPSGISGVAEVVRVCSEVGAVTSLSMLAVLERQQAGTAAADCISARIGELKAAATKAAEEHAKAEKQRLALLQKQEEDRKRDEATRAEAAKAEKQRLALLQKQEEDRKRDEATGAEAAKAEKQRLALLRKQEDRKRGEAAHRPEADAPLTSTTTAASQKQAFRDLLAGGQPCAFCPEMVEVAQGSFTMGSPRSEPQRDDDEEPRRVQISKPFAASRHPITVEQFSAFVEATDYKVGNRCHAFNGQKMEMNAPRSWSSPGFEQSNNHPVVCVNWQDAQAFVGWLSNITGRAYRLLSEAEREYITRAGATSSFWWGTTISSDQANFDARSIYLGGGKKGDFRQRTVPVDSFNPNPWGFYNVHGNVWDWTSDCFHSAQGGKKDKANADAVSDCQMRVLRGGSWYNSPSNLRSANRTSEYSASRSAITGFRVARELSGSKR